MGTENLNQHGRDDDNGGQGKDDKFVTIYVETKPHQWLKNEPISFVQVVQLEVPGYTPQSNITWPLLAGQITRVGLQHTCFDQTARV